MGTYLYGLKWMRKPVTATLDDGRAVEVEVELVYKRKPRTSGWVSDTATEAAVKRLVATFGNRFTGFVKFGGAVVEYAGAPYWFDCGREPFVVVKREQLQTIGTVL